MLALLTSLLLGCLAAPQEGFLERVDRALKTRDRAALVRLIDWEGWRASGGADPARLRLQLPPPPLTRTRELAAREYLYRDGEGREWRLRLTEAGGRLRVLALARPCPPSGVRRGPIGDEPGGEPRRQPASEVFTPLECWPLPR